MEDKPIFYFFEALNKKVTSHNINTCLEIKNVHIYVVSLAHVEPNYISVNEQILPSSSHIFLTSLPVHHRPRKCT